VLSVRHEKRAALRRQKLKPPMVTRRATAIASQAAMAAMAIAVAAAGAAGVRVVGATTGRETVGLIVGRIVGLIVVHGVAPVAVARVMQMLRVMTLKLD
jgi:putative N-acetylmannosamine-6-phosphate epimerase